MNFDRPCTQFAMMSFHSNFPGATSCCLDPYRANPSAVGQLKWIVAHNCSWTLNLHVNFPVRKRAQRAKFIDNSKRQPGCIGSVSCQFLVVCL